MSLAHEMELLEELEKLDRSIGQLMKTRAAYAAQIMDIRAKDILDDKYKRRPEVPSLKVVG